MIFYHAWTILFQEPLWKGRLSRGEYVISLLIINALGAFIVRILWFIIPELRWIFILIIQWVWGLSMWIRRAHDLGKDWKFVIYPTIFFLCVSILIYYISFQVTPFSWFKWWHILSLIVFLLVILWLFCVLLILFFKKWTSESNAYGAERISLQPKSDVLYWLMGIVLLFIVFIFNQQSLTMKQQIDDNITNNEIEKLIQELENNDINQ